jgi:uncharacterized protein (TIGR03435 family)
MDVRPRLGAPGDQIGLKLDATTGKVDELVIDHVEHPTEH